MSDEKNPVQKDTLEGLWFKAKDYGWGWAPITWQGWLLTFVYTFFVLLTSAVIIYQPIYIFLIVFFTIGLIGICFIKGEKPELRWKGKKVDFNLQTKPEKPEDQ